jgi:FdhE protein
VENSIKPILEVYADELKEYVDQDTWWRGYCPICGSAPLIAGLREEGERFLVCSSCSYEWRFRRLKCPFCENEDHKGLRYFYTEREGKVNRVDVCEKCKTYIKAIDLRELPSDFISFVEDAGTLYMDVLAQTKGYRRLNDVWGERT